MSLRADDELSDHTKRDMNGCGQEKPAQSTGDTQLLNVNVNANSKCSPPGGKSSTNGGPASVRRRKDQAKYYTLPISSHRERLRSGLNGQAAKETANTPPATGGTRKSVIRSWLSKWGKKPVQVPASLVDKCTQTENLGPVSMHRAAMSVKCVNCVNSIDYCCPSGAGVMCNCPSCPPTLLVPSVVNGGQTGSGHSVVHPCATVYYAEPVDPSCLQCIASCPPSLICPGGYKCSGLFNSSCNNVSNSNSCQNNSALATAAAATATTTTSTGVLQRDMYC